jgi:hypothetical protein
MFPRNIPIPQERCPRESAGTQFPRTSHHHFLPAEADSWQFPLTFHNRRVFRPYNAFFQIDPIPYDLATTSWQTVYMNEPTTPSYRIEHHRRPDASVLLGFCDKADRPQLALAPYAEQLLKRGETGEVVLIDQATEEIIAVRHLVHWPFRD